MPEPEGQQGCLLAKAPALTISDFRPALEEPLEKTLRCQEVVARGLHDPTDLVLRNLSKMEIKDRCGRSVGPSLLEPGVGGELPEAE